MLLSRITEQLDAFFHLDEFPPDTPFSALVPSVYGEARIDLARYLTPRFMESFHGLMIRNGEAVAKAYCTVFLSEETLGKVLAQEERDVLIVSHHPLVMETSDRGFLSLSGHTLVEMQQRGVSVYILHTPLDVHGELSTGRALARELGLGELKGFYLVLGRPAALCGRFGAPVRFVDLLTRVSEVSGVHDLHHVRHHDTVQTAAVIPGGTDVEGILLATQLGCDVLVTGTYWNQVQNAIGQRYREEFERIRDDLKISLVECSHYASEAVVMRMDMVSLIKGLGIDCAFIAQDDPWY
jgi:putative NIF3 family GTP cyclohydrolase 1 type 2